MSAEELKAAIHRIIEEIWNKGNLDVADEVDAADYVYHNSPFPDIVGREAFKQYVAGARIALPDLHVTADEIIVEGNTTVTRYTWRGTHTGQSPTLPIPPTGKQVIGSSCAVVRFVEGKAVEAWVYDDWLGVLQQMGVVPPLG